MGFVWCVKPELVWADHGTVLATAALSSIEGIITLIYSERMMALPSNLRDNRETNLMLFQIRSSGFNFLPL